jgi:hypothetical protein
VLQIGKRFRHHWMGDGQMIGCFRNTAVLRHREQDVQVAQLEAAANPV